MPLSKVANSGAVISRKTMGGWLTQCGKLLAPLYDRLKTYIWQSKVIGTDDTSVKVLGLELHFSRTGRFWPYLGDAAHRAVIFDYTRTRARAGPEAFLAGYQGYLQADAYGVYDAFFKGAEPAMTEVACWAHARRYAFHARETDTARMGVLLLLILRLYRIEKEAAPLSTADRHQLRQTHARPILQKIHDYLLSLESEVLPKSPAGRAVRYLLNQWEALNRYCDDGDLSIDNNATERTLRSIAIGRHNWTFLGSDSGGHTAAVLRSFTGSRQLIGVEPFARHGGQYHQRLYRRTLAAQPVAQPELVCRRANPGALVRYGRLCRTRSVHLRQLAPIRLTRRQQAKRGRDPL